VIKVALAAIGLLAFPVGYARAGATSTNEATIRGCVTAAADAYREPPAVLVVLLNVEGGSLGQISYNTNGTIDIGPMQVNQIWLPNVAAHWRTTVPAAYAALRDNFCANVEAGAWILRRCSTSRTDTLDVVWLVPAESRPNPWDSRRLWSLWDMINFGWVPFGAP
jgi:hypothetical protein